MHSRSVLKSKQASRTEKTDVYVVQSQKVESARRAAGGTREQHHAHCSHVGCRRLLSQLFVEQGLDEVAPAEHVRGQAELNIYT